MNFLFLTIAWQIPIMIFFPWLIPSKASLTKAGPVKVEPIPTQSKP